MKLFGLLNFYDESPSQLTECIHGLKFAGVDSVIAVDGAYDLYPGAKTASPASQRTAIDQACRRLHMGSCVYVPDKTWAGNEVEKRTFMHRLALVSSTRDDWHMVMDADQVVIEVPPDFRVRLEQTALDVAEVTFQEFGNFLYRPRILFRAIPIHLERNHYTYIAGDRCLWSSDDQPQEPCVEIRELVVDHRPARRTTERLKRRAGYYTVRTENQTEFFACQRCSTGRAVRKLPTRWRTDPIVGHVGDWIEVCMACVSAIQKENQGALSAMGLDPTLLTVIPKENSVHVVSGDARALPDLFREWLKERT